MGALQHVPCCLSEQQCQHEAESEKDFMEDEMERGGGETTENYAHTSVTNQGSLQLLATQEHLIATHTDITDLIPQAG